MNNLAVVPKNAKIVDLAISELVLDLFVRHKLDEDRVMFWAVKFEEDPNQVDPIEVTQDNSVTDGRHRIAGAELAGCTSLRGYIVTVRNKAEQLERAFLSNVAKGPLAPKKADVVLTIKQMIHNKVARQRIIDVVSEMYPKAAVTRFFDEARAGIRRDSLMAAKREVHENGMSVPAAAAKHNVEIEALKVELGGKRTKGKVNLGELKTKLSTQFRSQGQIISKILSTAEAAYDNADMTREQMFELLEYFTSYIKKQEKSIFERKNRFENKTK